MIFTQAELAQLVAGQPIGKAAPYKRGRTDKIDRYLQKVAKRLAKVVKGCEVVLENEQEGAIAPKSFMAIYIQKAHGAATTTARQANGNTVETTQGLYVYLSRLAPYAVWGGSTVAVTYQDGNWHNSQSNWLLRQGVAQLPGGQYAQEAAAITRSLSKAGLTCLTHEAANAPIPEGLAVPPTLKAPPYALFDCLFYWL